MLSLLFLEQVLSESEAWPHDVAVIAVLLPFLITYGLKGLNANDDSDVLCSAPWSHLPPLLVPEPNNSLFCNIKCASLERITLPGLIVSAVFFTLGLPMNGD
ncbi:hypothetical protein PIB30_038764 [Stylosanthes scabra]|uniref:Uncharacterized protein n=1 Tax=Stylosanthes scabra TaxID=79078 RepID=A0ABU6WF41_9FABA|nr:hypothetical protein [Stylosanthes scabra]